MAAQWFYQTSEGQQSGPVDSAGLRRLAQAGIVRPDTPVRKGDDGPLMPAKKVRGLWRKSDSTPSPAKTPPAASAAGREFKSAPPPPVPIKGPPLPPAVPVAPADGSPEKPDRIHPITWASIIVGAGCVLLLLWAMVFRGDSEPRQQAEKDRPPLVAAESAESEDSAPARQPVSQPAKTTPATAPAAEPKPVPPTGNVKILELADLAELVGPSVVQVDVTRPGKAATGSGFVLEKQGTIVTNFHVIEDATAGRIVFSDRTSTPITGYLGVWPEKDIALVRVECPPEKLHPLRLATSAPRQGERVAAFGSPLGLQQSVSEGIVSAVRESKELRALGPIDVNARLIQTTAPISHGNSGGPLVDMKGMVVGVNTWTFRFLGGENVNFAVAAVELPPLLLAKNETPSPLPASDPAADGVRRILRRASAHLNAREYDRAIADYTEALRLDPKSGFAYFGRGEAYRLKRDYDSAIADYTQAIRLDPRNADFYCSRGEAYYAKHDYDSAIADFTDALRLDPKSGFAYFGRGEAYYCKRDYDKAIADYTEIIRLDPKKGIAYRRRAFAYERKHDYDSAIAGFTQAIRLDPRNADLYHWRAEAYRAKDDYDKAIADYTEIIRLDPKRGIAYSWRGDAYERKHDYDSAIADYTEVIRLDPKDAFAYFSRGEAYCAKHDYDSAIADFTEIIRLEPKKSWWYSVRAGIHMDAGNYDLAIADYSEVIRLAPKTAAYSFHRRGEAYQKKGQRAAAERDFARAKRLGYKP